MGKVHLGGVVASKSRIIGAIVATTLMIKAVNILSDRASQSDGYAVTELVVKSAEPMANKDQECRVEILSTCNSSRLEQQAVFTDTYKHASFGVDDSHFIHERSGTGSTLHGAFDLIWRLENFMYEHNITSVADVPSGDLGWQFAIHPINTAQVRQSSLRL